MDLVLALILRYMTVIDLVVLTTYSCIEIRIWFDYFVHGVHLWCCVAI